MKRLTEATECEIVIQKSRFLTYLFPMTSLEEVEAKQKELKKIHRKANHVCYAYRFGLAKPEGHFSDDGEPSQTAGLPMFTVLEGEEVTDIGAFVVRYFGGIKLGTGGLVRAYTEAVKEGLNQAKFQEIVKLGKFHLKYGYQHHNQVQNVLKGAASLEPQFLEDVTWTVYLPDKSKLETLRDLTDGTIKIRQEGEVYLALTDTVITELGGNR